MTSYMYTQLHIYICIIYYILLLDTIVVHPLPSPNSKHKLTLIEAKQNLRAADKACARKKKKYDVICAQNGLKFLPISFQSTGKMHPLLQDFLAVVMDTMTMHINPHITMFYWSARLSCCLEKSIAKSLSRKYSASNGLAAKGLHFSLSVILTVSFPLSEISRSYLLVWLHMLETMIVIPVRRTRSPSPP